MSKRFIRSVLLLLILAMVISPLEVLAADLTSPATNLSASYSGSGVKATASTGSITMNIQGDKWSNKAGTLTLKNGGTETATLSFSYVATGTVSEFKVAGVDASSAGIYSTELEPEAYIEIYLKVNSSGLLSSAKNASVTLSGVKLEVPQNANVTFSHNGSGSISVGGTPVNSGDTVEILSTGATIAATPASGATFLAWVDAADYSVVSTAASLTYKPSEDITLKAIFASTTNEVCFWGSSKSYLFDNLSAAISHAQSVSNKQITLAGNGTLSAGNYTIPAGITLLIPFDSNGTCYTETPGADESNWTKPSAYYTMTMASGAQITVDGAISVSAKISAKMGYAGNPTSKYGHVEMNEGSSITVNSGANLYAWGYITGSGNVTIKSGGAVYESFQVTDWRGGTYTTRMLNNSAKVFPMTQYYVQNVEVPMTLESGATEKCSLAAVISSFLQQKIVPFIGKSGNMFNIESGSVTKRYDGSTDRLIVDVNGTFSVGEISIVMAEGILGIGRVEINSTKYVLPVSNNISINIGTESTMTFNQTASLLPGARVNIAEAATLKLGSGKQLYVYDATEWVGKRYTYYSTGLTDFTSVVYAPSKTYTRTVDADIVDAQILVNGTLDASEGYLYTTNSGGQIYSTGSGQVILNNATVSHKLSETTQTSDQPAYEEIPITTTKLKEADDNYRNTGADTYYYADGKWNCTNHAYDVETDPATCTEDGLKTSTCIACEKVETEVLTSTGHTEGEAVVENVVNATCTAEGSYDNVVYCTACKAELSRNTVTVDKVAHTEAAAVEENRTESTCTVAGSYDSVVYCSVCNEELSRETKALELAAHTEGAVVAENEVAATCTAEGSYDNVVYCTVCNEELSRNTVTVEKIAHTPAEAVEENRKESTCTVAGSYESVVYCSACNTELSRETKALELAAHTEGAVVVENEVAATCTAEGSYDNVVYCTVCNEELSRNTVTVEKIAHAYEAVVTAPTCTAKGYTTYTCSACGDSYVADEVAALGHTEVTDEAVEPDCTNTGLTEGSHCSVCDAVLVAQEIVPATGHVNTTTTTVDATCTEAGSVTVTCSCGEVVSTEIIPATGHTYGEPAWTWDLEAEPVTCTATFTCTVCAAPEEGANDIADRVVTEDCAVEEKNCTDATCGKDGSVVYTATVEFGDQTYANDSEAVTIPSTGEHSYVNGVCDVCGDQEVKLTQFIKSVSVDLGNSLALKFIIDPDLNDDGVLELTSNDNYAVISKLVNGTWTVVKESPQSEWDTYNNSRFVAVYDDIAAKNMADKFKIVLYNKFGEAISVEYEDTVRDYAKRGVISLSSLSNPTTKQLKQLTMFVDFLNYGAAAQVNFNYNTGDLANSVLTEEHQKYATPSASAENKRVGDGGTAVSVESRIELGFTFDKTLVTRDMYAVVSYTKHTGTLYNETILGADFEDYSNTKWRIPVFKLSTADGNQMITCTIYDAEGHQVAQAKDSINSYMARVLVSSKASANLKNLATAALKLTASAYAYFH